MTARGFFVTVEGPEASGKTTAIEQVTRELALRGCNPLRTREPGGTQVGVAIRKLLLDGSATPCSRSEFLLFQADRAQHVEDVIEPALAGGRLIVCDRYILSSIAYQVEGRNIPRDSALEAIKLATKGLVPDLTILLTVNLDVGMKRLARRGAENRLDNESRQFHESVHRAYEKYYGGAFAKSWLRIDTSPHYMTPDVVARLMTDAIMRAHQRAS